MTEADRQLELFDVPRQRAHRYSLPPAMGALMLRYDHAVLLGIGMLISVSAVFAWGVERGKDVARAERPLLPATTLAESPASETVASSERKVKSTSSSSDAKDEPEEKAPAKTTPAPVKKLRAPVRVAEAQSGFAIQVVTYSQPTLAQRELTRLKERGEAVFLVTKQGKSVLFVGPFSTKANASQKLTSLKKRYQDCFIRSL